MSRIVEVLTAKADLIERAQEIILSQVRSAIEARGSFTIALAGGSTPKPLYEALSGQSLPWSKMHIFWGDERYVPPTDSQSNQLMARQALIDQIEIPAANVHPMNIAAGNPAQDAQNYEAHLREFFQLQAPEIPAFDLILLGMGDDGHTASLFPHTDVLQVEDRLIGVGIKDGQPRLTFTAPLINQARCVIFLVAGENKRPALKEVFAEQADSQDYPSRMIQPQGKLIWLLDQAAGAML